MTMSEDTIVERIRNDPDFPAALAARYRALEADIKAQTEISRKLTEQNQALRGVIVDLRERLLQLRAMYDALLEVKR
jgi:hypothetical protein